MNKIKFYREQQQLQLKDLAIATGLSIGHISHLENSGRLPSVASMDAIAKALNKSVPEVFYPDADDCSEPVPPVREGGTKCSDSIKA